MMLETPSIDTKAAVMFQSSANSNANQDATPNPTLRKRSVETRWGAHNWPDSHEPFTHFVVGPTIHIETIVCYTFVLLQCPLINHQQGHQTSSRIAKRQLSGYTVTLK